MYGYWIDIHPISTVYTGMYRFWMNFVRQLTACPISICAFFRILQHNGLQPEEMADAKFAIYSNVNQSMQILLNAMETLQLKFDDPAREVCRNFPFASKFFADFRFFLRGNATNANSLIAKEQFSQIFFLRQRN